ncbi:hypothetical protein [Georgenia sp. H159]|uniref:hypothetical protein n=1 Tax=Georgenia sp. H159 TaxID=3076115 RepID=UPI002D782F0A|nr:hypothetical protein [Georgenia sp. H159]
MSRRHSTRTLDELIEDYTSPQPLTAEEARQQLLTWGDELAHATLDVCNMVFRIVGAKYYAAHHDVSLRADLEDWLIVRAVELAQTWAPSDPVPADDLTRRWRTWLTVSLKDQARFHFRDMVGKSEEAQAAHHGQQSLERLTEDNGDDWLPVRLHGHDLFTGDPEHVYFRMLHLTEQLDRAERHIAEHGGPSYTTESIYCIEPGCMTHAATGKRGYCDRHYRQHMKHWGRADGAATCSEDDCPLVAYSRGWCKQHYDRARREGIAAGTWQARAYAHATGCQVPDCGAPVKARSLCEKHYRATRRAERKAS